MAIVQKINYRFSKVETLTKEDGEEAAGGGGFSGKDDGEQTAVIFPQPLPLFISKVVFFFLGLFLLFQ